MNTIYKLLDAIVKDNVFLKLGENDIFKCLEYLEHFEYGLCFDTIVTQLYENEIKIDKNFYDKISNAAIKLHIDLDEYSFLRELIYN